MLKLEKPIVFFDIETTGLDVGKDRIVQIAFIKFYPNGDKQEGDYILNPMMPISKEASDVHGITDEMVKNKPTFYDVVDELYDIFKDSDVGGYNSNSFDLPFLLSEFERVGKSLNLTDVNLVDVFEIEKLLNKRTLEAVYERYTGKKLDNAHDALADIKATITVLKHQIKSGGLPNTTKGLDDFSQQEKKRVDLSNKLVEIDGKICWNFGKHKYKPVKDTVDYAYWFLGNNIPSDTRQIILKEIKL